MNIDFENDFVGSLAYANFYLATAATFIWIFAQFVAYGTWLSALLGTLIFGLFPSVAAGSAFAIVATPLMVLVHFIYKFCQSKFSNTLP